MTQSSPETELWAHGKPGRIVTYPDPDAYVLVDGILVRATPDGPGCMPGAEVELRYDAAAGRLVAGGNR